MFSLGILWSTMSCMRASHTAVSPGVDYILLLLFYVRIRGFASTLFHCLYESCTYQPTPRKYKVYQTFENRTGLLAH